jgi:leucyl-tRNA synthetase
MNPNTSIDNTALIEKKWREKWQEARLFQPDQKPKKEKRFVTAAFPYPNSPQHIGHARTYTTADIYARYLRLKGYNVLFPMAFHVTGTPILAMAKRIAAKDQEVLKVFREIYGIPDETSATLTDPYNLVSYFSKEIEQGMKEMGFSIDWRRKFYSFDPKFSRFIQWQFRKLKDLNYLVKGEYPIAWCPSDKQAVGAHDTKGDVDPELEEVTMIKFRHTINSEASAKVDSHTSGAFSFVVTTYRPETTYGVTNLWINPKVDYVYAEYNGETILIAKKAAEILNLQLNLKIIRSVKGEMLLDMHATNPLTKETIPILPASFVSEEVGTGIVMSVPAHAPYDYLALRDLGKDTMRIPLVISLPGYGHIPAKTVVEKLKVKDQNDPLAEQATAELYKKEAHEGIMLAGKYKGEKAISAKEKIAADMKNENIAFTAMTLANAPVYCRCGSSIVVNILKDQWFIDYSNAEWKKKTHACLDSMITIPEKTRDEYNYTIDWLKTRPCARAAGLGTKFPFDESKMIEALSDSTIYMAYYTIAHLLADFSENELDENFFDAVFLGTGHKTKDQRLKELRRSFLYWYPIDSRHSAGDLIRNHLTLYLFNHTAVFDKNLWPKQIVTNGFVLMDGSKMSKSIGNILPLRKAINEYGADIIRFSVVSGADLTHDTDFNKTVAEGTKSRLAFITSLIEKTKNKKTSKKSRIDKWLLSRLNKKIQVADELYRQCMLRHLGLEIFYDVVQDLKWYEKRAVAPHLHDFFERWIPLICPFMPHHAEGFWEMLGGKGFVSNSAFPKYNKKEVDEDLERGEELVKQVHADIEKISTLLGKKPQLIKIYVASAWKQKVYTMLRELKAFDKVMQKAAKNQELKKHMNEINSFVKQLMKNVHSLPDLLSEKEEFAALVDAIAFFKKEFNCEVLVKSESEQETENGKRKSAIPGKPAIVIE